MKDPVASTLDTYVNTHISGICGCSFHSDNENHCAHFVCHMLEYRFGLTCYGMTKKGSADQAANIRVQEVFPRCVSVGKWADKPASLKKGLIFIAKPGNVHLNTKTIDNVPRKHIGIFIEADIWQYKNRVKHVVKQTHAEFAKHYDYAGKGFETYYGEFPL